MAYGILYIMTTSIDGVIKIGKTRKDQYKERMRKLETDGYRTLAMHKFYAAYVSGYDEKEILIHKIFDKSRLGDSELFALDKNLVKELMQNFEGKQVFPQAITKEHKSRSKSFSFNILNIPIGSELCFKDDINIKCVVKDNKNKVIYENKEYTLSNLAQKLRNSKHAPQGPACFTYEGKLLIDIRKEIEE